MRPQKKLQQCLGVPFNQTKDSIKLSTECLADPLNQTIGVLRNLKGIVLQESQQNPMLKDYLEETGGVAIL